MGMIFYLKAKPSNRAGNAQVPVSKRLVYLIANLHRHADYAGKEENRRER